jgi:hypothetical protein
MRRGPGFEDASASTSSNLLLERLKSCCRILFLFFFLFFVFISEPVLISAVHLLQGKELRENDEAMCELLETLSNPNPAPESWARYGETLNSMGLLESMYRVLRTSKVRPRVLSYAAKALGTLAGTQKLSRRSCTLSPT